MLEIDAAGKPVNRAPGRWASLPISLRAVISGLLIAVASLNVWPLLLLSFGMPVAAFLETIFLALFLWWTGGGGPPRSTVLTRTAAFGSKKLSSTQWSWSLVAALLFAATVHSSIVLLFRFVPFPMASFRHGYDISFIPSQFLRWLTVIVSALSAGICEETGFRGYLQRPIEQRHGAAAAILISSLLFTILHFSKAWAILGMVPIVFGAGLLLGLLAWSSRSLIPCMIGHVLMDIGLFAYWWTAMAGDFSARTIRETGLDQPFLITLAVFAVSLTTTLLAISKLRQIAKQLEPELLPQSP